MLGRNKILGRKKKILFDILVFIILQGLTIISLSEKTDAAVSSIVNPSVNVIEGGSLSLLGTSNTKWSNAAKGIIKDSALYCTINTNTSLYDIKVSTDEVLTSKEKSIVSSVFTYTSKYNPNTPKEITYQTSPIELTSTLENGKVSNLARAVSNLKINIAYAFNIPPDETLDSNYIVTHTYTLIAL